MAIRVLIASAALLLTAGIAQASDWTVDAETSTLGFTFIQEGKEIEGKFDSWDADITFDPEDLDNASAKVTIEIDSVDAGSRSRTRSAKGKNWLARKKHPQATFETTTFRETGEGAYEADATLTIRDQSNPITLPFTLAFDGDTVKMVGSVALDRKAFGVGESNDDVGAQVTVNVDLTATRAP